TTAADRLCDDAKCRVTRRGDRTICRDVYIMAITGALLASGRTGPGCGNQSQRLDTIAGNPSTTTYGLSHNRVCDHTGSNDAAARQQVHVDATAVSTAVVPPTERHTEKVIRC